MSRPLSKTLEIVDRSLSKVILDKLVEEGYAVDREIPGILSDKATWESEEQLIIQGKGFVVEFFGASNNHRKLEKEVPRIVYTPQRLMPGDVGNSPGPSYIDGPSNGYYKTIEANQTSNYQFKIGIHAENITQFRLMHSIIAACIPHREFIPLYNDPAVKFLITQYSYQDSPDLKKGILEGYYLYEVVDLFEHEPIQNEFISQLAETELEVLDRPPEVESEEPETGNLQSTLQTILQG